MSLFSILGINAHSLSSFQKGIDLTNKNINNLNNKDYAKESAVFSELSSYGVTMSQAKRIYDERYFDRYVQENQTFNYYQEFSSSLDTVEAIFNDIQGSGFAQELDDYYSALNEIVSQPENLAVRDGFLEKTKVLLSKMKMSYDSLQSEKQNLSYSITQEVQDINRLSQELAKINQAIAAQPATLVGEQEKLNTLLNQRDKLIKELSSHIDTKVRYNADNTVDIFSAKGHTIVLGDKSFSFSTAKEGVAFDNGLTTTSTRLMLNGVDLTSDFSKGSLSAKLHSEAFIIDKMDALNKLAVAFGERNNQIHTQGYDLNGNEGKELFINQDDPNSAFNIKNITLNITDPAEIAASSDLDAPSNNKNAQALYNLKDEKQASLNNTTFYNYYIDLVASIGNKKRSLEGLASDSERMLATLDSKMQEISGVNLDEELANLMQLQRSYEAAARVLSVTDNLLETVMNIIR